MLLLFAVVMVGKLVLSAHWGLMADEAYYWVWTQHLAWGYYDQPPFIAWVMAASVAVLGDSELAVRLPTVVAGAAAPLFLWKSAGDKRLLLLWWLGVPSLCWLGWLGTPDATLLAGWALALAGACRGGRWWLLAGLGAAVAFLSKYSGAGVLPLLMLAAGPRELRTPWPWLGAALAAVLVFPNLLWNANNDWVAFAFQFHEGLVSDTPPGLAGAARQVLEQALVLTPLCAAAAVWWVVRTAPTAIRWREAEPTDRVVRMAWMSSVPILVFFTVAATRDVAEAHWPAIAYVGIGLGLSHADGILARLTRVGAWVGLMITGVLVVHTLTPLWTMTRDPAMRFTEGRIVAAGVASWAYPVGVDQTQRAPDGARTVYTERYQEASWVHFYTGIPARRHLACGRQDQYDLWPVGDEHQPLFVRPGTRNRDNLCVDADFERGPAHVFEVIDDQGRRTRKRQVFELTRRR